MTTIRLPHDAFGAREQYFMNENPPHVLTAPVPARWFVVTHSEPEHSAKALLEMMKEGLSGYEEASEELQHTLAVLLQLLPLQIAQFSEVVEDLDELIRQLAAMLKAVPPDMELIEEQLEERIVVIVEYLKHLPPQFEKVSEELVSKGLVVLRSIAAPPSEIQKQYSAFKQREHALPERLKTYDEIIDYITFYNELCDSLERPRSAFRPVNIPFATQDLNLGDQDAPYAAIAVMENPSRVMVFRLRRYDDEEFTVEMDALDAKYGIDNPYPAYTPQAWQDPNQMREYTKKRDRLREKYRRDQSPLTEIILLGGEPLVGKLPDPKNTWVTNRLKLPQNPELYEGRLYDAYGPYAIFQLLNTRKDEPPLFFANAVDIQRTRHFPDQIHEYGQSFRFDAGFGENGHWFKHVRRAPKQSEPRPPIPSHEPEPVPSPHPPADTSEETNEEEEESTKEIESASESESSSDSESSSAFETAEETIESSETGEFKTVVYVERSGRLSDESLIEAIELLEIHFGDKHEFKKIEIPEALDEENRDRNATLRKLGFATRISPAMLPTYENRLIILVSAIKLNAEQASIESQNIAAVRQHNEAHRFPIGANSITEFHTYDRGAAMDPVTAFLNNWDRILKSTTTPPTTLGARIRSKFINARRLGPKYRLEQVTDQAVLQIPGSQKTDEEYSYRFNTSSGDRVKLLLWVIAKKPCIRCRKTFSDSENGHGACQWHPVHPEWYRQLREGKLLTLQKFLDDPEKQAQLGIENNWPGMMKFSELFDRCVTSKLFLRIRDKCRYLETKYGVATADELPDSKESVRYSQFTHGGIFFPTGSLFNSSLSGLEHLASQSWSSVNSDDPTIRATSRILKYILSDRSVEKCLRSLDFDPKDPVTIPVDFSQVSPHWHWGQVRFKEEKMNVRNVWACCGQARLQRNGYGKTVPFKTSDNDWEAPVPTPEVPGCYTGRHSMTERNPDLHIQTVDGVIQRGTDYIGFPKTTTQLSEEVRVAFSKHPVDMSALIEFNSWHGGIPVPEGLKIKDDASEKLYRKLFRRGDRSIDSFFAVNRAERVDNHGWHISRIEQLQYNRNRSAFAFPAGLTAVDRYQTIETVAGFLAGIPGGQYVLPPEPPKKQDDPCQAAPKPTEGVVPQTPEELMRATDAFEKEGRNLTTWLGEVKRWARKIQKWEKGTSKSIPPTLNPATTRLNDAIVAANAAQAKIERMRSEFQKRVEASGLLKAFGPSTRELPPAVLALLREFFSIGLPLLNSLREAALIVQKRAAAVSTILKAMGVTVEKDGINPEYPRRNEPTSFTPPTFVPSPRRHERKPMELELERQYSQFVSERVQLQTAQSNIDRIWGNSVWRWIENPRLNRLLTPPQLDQLSRALDTFTADIQASEAATASDALNLDVFLSRLDIRITDEKYEGITSDRNIIQAVRYRYLGDHPDLAMDFTQAMKSALAALQEVLTTTKFSAEKLSLQMHRLGMTQEKTGINPDYPGRTTKVQVPQSKAELLKRVNFLDSELNRLMIDINRVANEQGRYPRGSSEYLTRETLWKKLNAEYAVVEKELADLRAELARLREKEAPKEPRTPTTKTPPKSTPARTLSPPPNPTPLPPPKTTTLPKSQTYGTMEINRFLTESREQQHAIAVKRDPINAWAKTIEAWVLDTVRPKHFQADELRLIDEAYKRFRKERLDASEAFIARNEKLDRPLRRVRESVVRENSLSVPAEQTPSYLISEYLFMHQELIPEILTTNAARVLSEETMLRAVEESAAELSGVLISLAVSRENDGVDPSPSGVDGPPQKPKESPPKSQPPPPRTLSPPPQPEEPTTMRKPKSSASGEIPMETIDGILQNMKHDNRLKTKEELHKHWIYEWAKAYKTYGSIEGMFKQDDKQEWKSYATEVQQLYRFKSHGELYAAMKAHPEYYPRIPEFDGEPTRKQWQEFLRVLIPQALNNWWANYKSGGAAPPPPRALTPPPEPALDIAAEVKFAFAPYRAQDYQMLHWADRVDNYLEKIKADSRAILSRDSKSWQEMINFNLPVGTAAKDLFEFPLFWDAKEAEVTKFMRLELPKLNGPNVRRLAIEAAIDNDNHKTPAHYMTKQYSGLIRAWNKWPGMIVPALVMYTNERSKSVGPGTEGRDGLRDELKPLLPNFLFVPWNSSQLGLRGFDHPENAINSLTPDDQKEFKIFIVAIPAGVLFNPDRFVTEMQDVLRKRGHAGVFVPFHYYGTEGVKNRIIGGDIPALKARLEELTDDLNLLPITLNPRGDPTTERPPHFDVKIIGSSLPMRDVSQEFSNSTAVFSQSRSQSSLHIETSSNKANLGVLAEMAWLDTLTA
jgi:hypothetical protein